jgi:hypothetical protein
MLLVLMNIFRPNGMKSKLKGVIFGVYAHNHRA